MAEPAWFYPHFASHYFRSPHRLDFFLSGIGVAEGRAGGTGRECFLTSFQMPSFHCAQYALLCSDRKVITVTLEGIPYPAYFLENQNAEAPASLPGTQWNPCSLGCAYFGFLGGVCHPLPGNGFSHPRGKCAICDDDSVSSSPWS